MEPSVMYVFVGNNGNFPDFEDVSESMVTVSQRFILDFDHVIIFPLSFVIY